MPNETLEEDGAIGVPGDLSLGCEGIVSKRLGSAYPSAYPWGRSPNWLKIKSPTAPAVKREAQDDWSR
jgi:ATP-dependent DNA ligase